MAVAHDGETNKTGQAGATADGIDITLSAKTTAGSNRVGILTVSHYAGTSNFTAGYPKWNGVSMTLGKDQQESDVIFMRASVFYIIDPPTGASDVVFQFATSITGAVYSASSYNGCDTAAVISASGGAATGASAGASPATVTVTTAAGEVLVDSIIHYALDAITAGANQTEIVNLTQSAIDGGSSRQAGSDGGVMSWTYTSDSYWAIAAVSLKAAAAASTPVVSNPIATLERPFNMALGRR